MKLKLIPIVCFILLALFFWRGLSLDPHKLPSAQLGRPVPQFELQRLDGVETPFSSKDLSQKVSVLNVWASWCEACVEEQVFLMELARQGIPLYGINYKDESARARDWLNRWGNPYIMVGEDKEGKTAIDLGVYGAPETFIIDKKGTIRYRHAGVLTEAIWNSKLKPLMDELEKAS